MPGAKHGGGLDFRQLGKELVSDGAERIGDLVVEVAEDPLERERA